MQPHALAGPPSTATPGGPEQTPPPLQHRPLPVPVSPPVAAAPVFSPASSPNQSNRRGSGANRSVASPTARARVPGGHGIPLSFGRATLPIPPPSPPPDMSPQSFTAKAAQAALAAAAAAANKAQERRVHQPAVGHELVMLRDAANAANIAAAAGVNKTEPQPQVVLESRDRATNTTAELADRIERGRSQQPTQPPQQAPQQQLQQQQQQEQQQPQQQQQGEAQHDRKRPIAFTPNTYKTEICRSHASTGNCEYGAYCQFAHGVAELRARDFDVKYKTKLCKNFYETGHCRFASRCKFIHDEQRVQVSETEFWLVSPSDNLVRVEVAHTPERRAQLQSLVTSTFTPPPYRVSPTHAPAPSSAPLAPVSNPSGTLPPPFALTDPAIPVRRNRDGSANASDDTTTDLHNTVAAFQTLAIAPVPPPVPASPQLQVPYFQYTVTAEPPPVFPMYGAPPPSATAPVPVYPSPLPYGSPLLGARGPGPDGYFVPHKGPAPPPPLVLAGPPVPPPPPPAMLIATQPHHVAFPMPLPPPPHVLAPPRVSRANLTDVATPTVSLRAPAQFHLHTSTASST